MTIQDYQTMTGTIVPDADVARIKAVIARSTAKLESLLGYSLSRQKTWTELGKIQYDGLIPFPSLPVGDDVLNQLSPADDASGDLQLFSFDELDKHIKINPAKVIYRAKVVLPVSDEEFMTIYDLENGAPYLNGAGLVTAVTRYHQWFTWTWWNSLMWADKSHLMLAVDADYFSLSDVSRYSDLAYLLCDMVSYYSDPAYSLLGNIRSETIDSHQYTRAISGAFNGRLPTADGMSPEGQPSGQEILQRYAGPGAYRKLVA